MKKKFLKFLEEEEFVDTSTNEQIQFNADRYTLKLEDNNWENICFDLYIDNTYVTETTTVKRLKKILELL